MFGFLFKVILVAAVVVGLVGVVYFKRGLPLPKNISQLTSQLPNQKTLLKGVKSLDVNQVGKQLSDALDSLVTHPDKNSPVVLGVKVTNDSISTLVDVVQKLPTDQLEQIKTAICASPLPQ